MPIFKKNRNTDPEYWLALLPPQIREEVRLIGSKIDDDTVSTEEFTEMGMELSKKVKKLPSAIQEAYHQAVKLLADTERKERRAAGEEVPDAPKLKKNPFK